MIARSEALFADASFYIALSSPTDPNHARAVELARRMRSDRRRMVTTAPVLIELGNGLARRLRSTAVALLRSIREDDRVEVVPLSEDLFAEGVTLYGHRIDKEWGLTDCISFVVMKERGIREALTADRHFRQAGFRPLLETD